MITFYEYQISAIEQLKNGSILCGGVGSGKSITALGYYLFKDCEGSVKSFVRKIDDLGNVEIKEYTNNYQIMKKPRDLYIITTAKKRDSLEWNKECSNFTLGDNREESHSNVKTIIDSWNNIKKYKDIYGSFFIFDEQRVTGSGAWVKTFLNISRKNHWILLSATPGDQWSDYIPIFVANGLYKNKTEFSNLHCVYSRISKYPKIEKYINQKLLEENREKILVQMKDVRLTERHTIYIDVEYNKEKYRTVLKNRWNPYKNEPISDVGEMMRILRRIVNEDDDRIVKVLKIISEKEKVIIFYNFDYELNKLKKTLDSIGYQYSEWNGHNHEEMPEGEKWVYLVQYIAGSEGWNCIKTDTIIFYSLNYSYRTTEQASGRIDRIDTPFHDLWYYYLRSRSSIDLAIYSKLKNKQNFNERAFLKNSREFIAL